MENSDRAKKHAKALRISSWMLQFALSKIPKNAPQSIVSKLNTIAIVTDCNSITAYHCVPILDGSGYCLAIKERAREIPRDFKSFERLFFVLELVLSYRVSLSTLLS